MDLPVFLIVSYVGLLLLIAITIIGVFRFFKKKQLNVGSNLTYTFIKDVDDTIHAESVSGRTDISEQTTGTIEGESENSITLDDVSSIYMVIEQQDSDKNENVQERIDLYQR